MTTTKIKCMITGAASLGLAFLLVLFVGGCVSGSETSGPVTEAQPALWTEIQHQLSQGLIDLYMQPYPYDPNAGAPFNIFQNSDGDLVAINLMATSKRGLFAGDELLVNNLRTAHEQTFDLVNNGRRFSLDGESYTLYSDFKTIRVVEDFGQRKEFTVDLTTLYQGRARHALVLSDYADINGVTYGIGKQGGPVGCLLFFRSGASSGLEADPNAAAHHPPSKPVYVVELAKVSASGDTVELGNEIPIDDTGYELKRDTPDEDYRCVKIGP